ncbi:MAG: YigZ family protein [Clostridia bacterium]
MYKTIREFHKDEFSFKHSKFICYSCPVKTNEDITNFINKIKSENKKATHNCYAYRLKENNITKCSDDKEPSGTAGVPILNIIKSKELFDVCIVITRYFGGILLGTGGLVHCYSEGANLATKSGNIITMKLCVFCKISCEYNILDKITSIIHKTTAKITNIEYGIENTNTVSSENNILSEKENFLENVTSTENVVIQENDSCQETECFLGTESFLNTEFDLKNEILFTIEKTKFEKLNADICEITSGKNKIEIIKTDYFEI